MQTQSTHAVLIILAAAFAGCSGHPNTSPTAAAGIPRQQETAAERDPCSLLEPGEVEAVLGAPLASPPYREQAGSPSQSAASCAYRDAGFHKIVVEVIWEGGPQIWKMYGTLQSAGNQNAKGMLHLADGSDLSGLWDEARVSNCCEFMALLGDQVVKVDTSDTVAVSIAQAAQLADAALKRIAKPLSINGDNGVQAAIAFDAAHRPKRVDPCTLLTRSEAETVIGPLTGDPVSKGDICTYPRPPNGHIGADVQTTVLWQGGFAQLRQSIGIAHSLASGFVAANSYLSPEAAKGIHNIMGDNASVQSSAWEASGPTVSGGLSAVKDDVLVRVDSIALTRADEVKLLTLIMPHIQPVP